MQRGRQRLAVVINIWFSMCCMKAKQLAYVTTEKKQLENKKVCRTTGYCFGCQYVFNRIQ